MMKILVILVLICLVSADETIITIGSDFNITVNYGKEFQLNFEQNKPAIVVFAPNKACLSRSPGVQLQIGESYQFPITTSGQFVLPITPDVSGVKNAIYFYISPPACNVSVSSFYVNDIDLTTPTTGELFPGYASFFKVSFNNNKALQLYLNKTEESCIFDIYWGSGNVSEIAYLERSTTTVNEMVIYPYYNSPVYSVMLQSSPTNKASCSFTLSANEVPINEINYQDGVSNDLIMSDQLYSLTKINGFPNDLPSQFNITSDQPIASITIRSNQKGVPPIVQNYNSTLTYPSYFVSIGSNISSTTFLLIRLVHPASNNKISATLTKITPTNINLNETKSGSLSYSQWDYFTSNLKHKYPQYLTVQVTSESDCASAYLVQDTNFPDSTNTGSPSSYKSRNDDTTIFRFALALDATDESQEYRIGISGISNSICNYLVTIKFEEFISLQNATDQSAGELTVPERFYFKYTIQPKDISTYLSIQVSGKGSLFYYQVLYYRELDIPTDTNYDGMLFPYTTNQVIYVPNESSDPIDVYFYYYGTSFELTVTEYYPTIVHANQEFPLVYLCQDCLSFFSLSEYESDLVSAQFNYSTMSDLSQKGIPVYVSVGSLPNKNSTLFRYGQFSMNDIGVSSWNNVYFAINNQYVSNVQSIILDTGISVSWESQPFGYFAPNDNELYFSSVIPKSSNLVQLLLSEYHGKLFDGFYMSWTGIPRYTSESIQIPIQGDDGDYFYSTPLTLNNDKTIYFKVVPSRNQSYTFSIYINDNLDTIYMSTSKPITGVLLYNWIYFKINWGLFFDQLNYDIYFNIQTNSTSLQAFYGGNKVPTTTSYELKGNQNGDEVTIKISNKKGSSFPSTFDTDTYYLGIYVGDKILLSTPASYSISAYSKERKSIDPIWIIIGVSAGVALISLAIVFIWRRYRARRGYLSIPN